MMHNVNSIGPGKLAHEINGRHPAAGIIPPLGGGNSGNGVKGQSSDPTVLYLGNLDPNVTEELILALFTQIGPVNSIKLIKDATTSEPFAFVEFADHQSAANAIPTMSRRIILGRELKVNWASSQGNVAKSDTSKHFHIFVGDLSPEIDTNILREAFAAFGEISDCRVVRDSVTMKSKGYGFVSFIKRHDAEMAISGMNGVYLGNRAIRTNWATRKPSMRGGGSNPPMDSSNNSLQNSGKSLTFDEIYQQTSPGNSTVYVSCASISNGLTEDVIHSKFAPYGPIQEIRLFKEKGYCFVRYASKESAANAIVSLQNTALMGSPMKCAWGRESSEASSGQSHNPLTASSPFPVGAIPAQYAAQYGFNPYAAPPISYWYQPAGYSPNTAPMQPNQFASLGSPPAGLQFSFGQYAPAGPPPFSPAGNPTALALQMGGWQGGQLSAGHPQNTHQIPGGPSPHLHGNPLGPGSAMAGQGPPPIMTYPMQAPYGQAQ